MSSYLADLRARMLAGTSNRLASNRLRASAACHGRWRVIFIIGDRALWNSGPKQWWHPVGSKKRAQEALNTVGLLHRQDVPLQVLSGGQQQRVRIARALVRDPDLLIMDEPLAGIDHYSQNKLAEIVGRLKDAGKTIILILHELGPLEPHLDRAIHIANGHVEFDGDPKDLPGVHAENHHHYPHPADMPSEDRFMGG